MCLFQLQMVAAVHYILPQIITVFAWLWMIGFVQEELILVLTEQVKSLTLVLTLNSSKDVPDAVWWKHCHFVKQDWNLWLSSGITWIISLTHSIRARYYSFHPIHLILEPNWKLYIEYDAEESWFTPWLTFLSICAMRCTQESFQDILDILVSWWWGGKNISYYCY